VKVEKKYAGALWQITLILHYIICKQILISYATLLLKSIYLVSTIL